MAQAWRDRPAARAEARNKSTFLPIFTELSFVGRLLAPSTMKAYDFKDGAENRK